MEMECDVYGMGAYLREARTEVGLAGKANFWPARKLEPAATEVLAVIARAAIAEIEQLLPNCKLEGRNCRAELRKRRVRDEEWSAVLRALCAFGGACGRGRQDFDAASANHRPDGRITPLTGSSGHRCPIPITSPFLSIYKGPPLWEWQPLKVRQVI